MLALILQNMRICLLSGQRGRRRWYSCECHLISGGFFFHIIVFVWLFHPHLKLWFSREYQISLCWLSMLRILLENLKKGLKISLTEICILKIHLLSPNFYRLWNKSQKPRQPKKTVHMLSLESNKLKRNENPESGNFGKAHNAGHGKIFHRQNTAKKNRKISLSRKCTNTIKYRRCQILRV